MSAPLQPRRILVVETDAHRPFGHYPRVFAQLAEALGELGCEVEALTRRGWVSDGDASPGSFRVRRFRGLADLAWRWTGQLRHVLPSALATRLVVDARTRLTVREARRVVRREGFTDVIITSGTNPVVAARLARPGRWLGYRFSPPPVAHASRPGRGAIPFRVVVGTPALAARWRDAAPWLRPTVVPFTTARVQAPVCDARAELGIPHDARVALLFGDHPRKDSAVVFRAFERLPEWTLVIAGYSGARSAADAYRAWAGGHETTTSPILFDGYVSDATRDLLFATADLVVTSFKPDGESDSGTLTEAIAGGCTIVCSDRCPSADVVRAHRLGTVFAPGDDEALVEAVRAAPPSPDPDGLEAARAEFDPKAVARLHLDALDDLDTG